MADEVPDALAVNLSAIAAVNRALAYRICLPVSSDHIEIAGETATYIVQSNRHRLSLSTEESRALASSAPESGTLLLFGLGLGEILDYLLDGSEERRIVAWERDPWLLRLALSRRDYRPAILSRRLVLALGIDLLDVLDLSDNVLDHPLLGHLYPNEAALLRNPLASRRALVCEGTLFVDDLASALRAEGFSVYTWCVSRLSSEELEYTARRLGPEVVVAVNYVTGLAETCESLGLRLAVWEIDPSIDPIRPLSAPAPRAHLFTWRKAHVGLWRAAGFDDVRHLPLAADPERRTRAEPDACDDSYRVDLAFVGASMVATARRHQEMFLSLYETWRKTATARDEATAALNAILRVQRDHPIEYVVPRFLEAHFGEFLSAMDRTEGVPDVRMLVGEMAAAEYRLGTIAFLGDLHIHVWGDEGWRTVAPYGANYRGPAGHYLELNRIYGAARVVVDIGRIYQRDIVTMRVFDVLACGGFVLAEKCPELAELFDIGREIECWSSREELKAKVLWALANPDQARQVAARGRERVLHDHTIRERVRTMLEALERAKPGTPA